MASSNASDLDQEHKDLTSLREEEGRRFAEKHAKFTKEHNEMIQRYRETPLNLEDAGLRYVNCVPLIFLTKVPVCLLGHAHETTRSEQPR